MGLYLGKVQNYQKNKEYVPSNSLLKEFVGGGDFKY